jgi:hypothetical protein
MYQALKTAQAEVNQTLLKFTDDLLRTTESRNNTPVNVPVNNNSNYNLINDTTTRLYSIQDALNRLSASQDQQMKSLTGAIENLTLTMSSLVTHIDSLKTVNAAQTIPSIQPTSSGVDLKNVCVDLPNEFTDVTHEGNVEESDDDEEEEVEEEELEEEVEVDEEVEEEVQEEVEEEEVEEEVEVEEEDEDDEVVVEEWVHKGTMYFKDSEETVYANENGEVGDEIGKYDPLKKIILPPPA